MTDSTVPKRQGADVAHALVRGTLGAIPIAGGLAGEVFALVLRPPLERRAEEWMNDIANRLSRLEKANPSRFGELVSDEGFCSVAIAATQAAFRSPHAEKSALLAHAVEQAAIGSDVDLDLQLTFVRFIDDLSVSHVRILTALVTSGETLAYVPSYAALKQLVQDGSGIICSPDEFMLFCEDLASRVLIRISVDLEPFNDVAKAGHLLLEGKSTEPLARVTDIGMAFLKFVTEPTAQAAA